MKKTEKQIIKNKMAEYLEVNGWDFDFMTTKDPRYHLNRDGYADIEKFIIIVKPKATIDIYAHEIAHLEQYDK